MEKLKRGTLRSRPARCRLKDRRSMKTILVMSKIAAIALGCAMIVQSARAELRIDITNANVKPLPIAVTDLYGSEVGPQISSVIAGDLESSGLFAPIDKRAFIQTPQSVQAVPRFGDWRVISAEALVTGNVQQQADGRLRVEFR